MAQLRDRRVAGAVRDQRFERLVRRLRAARDHPGQSSALANARLAATSRTTRDRHRREPLRRRGARGDARRRISSFMIGTAISGCSCEQRGELPGREEEAVGLLGGDDGGRARVLLDQRQARRRSRRPLISPMTRLALDARATVQDDVERRAGRALPHDRLARQRRSARLPTSARRRRTRRSSPAERRDRCAVAPQLHR